MEEPLAGSAPPATTFDMTDDAPSVGIPGAALPTNVPSAAKPVKARVVPVSYSDQALLRHIFRFVHGLPGDANLDAVARAAAKALKEASELGGDAVPEYLVAPAAASAAAPIASSDTPSWPHPLASIPSKASVTIGAVRATVKAHCVCERVSLLIQAPGMSVVSWGLCGCLKPSQLSAGVSPSQISVKLWAVKQASLAAAGVGSQPLAPFGRLRQSLPKASADDKGDEGAAEAAVPPAAAAASTPTAGAKRKASPGARVVADKENAVPAWATSGSGAAAAAAAVATPSRKGPSAASDASPAVAAASSQARPPPSSAQCQSRRPEGGETGGAAGGAVELLLPPGAAASTAADAPTYAVDAAPRIAKLRAAAAALATHALTTYCGFGLEQPQLAPAAAAAGVADAAAEASAGTASAAAAMAVPSSSLPAPFCALGVPPVSPLARLLPPAAPRPCLGWAVAHAPEWVASLAAAFWADPAVVAAATAGTAAAPSPSSPWEWPEAHVRLLAGLVQGAGAATLPLLSAAVVAFLGAHRPAASASSAPMHDSDGTGAEAAAAAAAWLPPTESVAARIALLAEQKHYGHKAHAAKVASAGSASVATVVTAAAAPVLVGPISIGQLAAGSSSEGGAASGSGWHPALALSRWEVSNAAHLHRTDPKQDHGQGANTAAAAAPAGGDSAPAAASAAAASAPDSHVVVIDDDDDDSAAGKAGGGAAGSAVARASAFARHFATIATGQQRWLKLLGHRVEATVRVADALAALAAASQGAGSGARPQPASQMSAASPPNVPSLPAHLPPQAPRPLGSAPRSFLRSWRRTRRVRPRRTASSSRRRSRTRRARLRPSPSRRRAQRRRRHAPQPPPPQPRRQARQQPSTPPLPARAPSRACSGGRSPQLRLRLSLRR